MPGIKGQKWGIRRFQNEDGTLTEEGKRRYGETDSGGKYINKDGTLTTKGKGILLGIMATPMVAVLAVKAPPVAIKKAKETAKYIKQNKIAQKYAKKAKDCISKSANKLVKICQQRR